MKARRNNISLLVATVLLGVSTRTSGDDGICYVEEVDSRFMNLGEPRVGIVEPGSELTILDVYWVPEGVAGGGGCVSGFCRSDELLVIEVRNDGFDYLSRTNEDNIAADDGDGHYYRPIDETREVLRFAVPSSPNYVFPVLHYSGVFADTRPATRTPPVAIACEDVRDLPREWCVDPLSEESELTPGG